MNYTTRLEFRLILNPDPTEKSDTQTLSALNCEGGYFECGMPQGGVPRLGLPPGGPDQARSPTLLQGHPPPENPTLNLAYFFLA